MQILGDETQRLIARELVDTVRRKVSIDWTLRESVRANIHGTACAAQALLSTR